MLHVPVLLKEVIEVLEPKPGEFFVDGTLGVGGYAKEIIKKISPGGVFLGVDWDEKLLEIVKEELEKEARQKKVSLFIRNRNYVEIPKILKEEKLPKVSGFVLDLGFSSWHIEKSKRGFSFDREEPLLMIYSLKNKKLTAYEVVNSFPERKLADIIYQYGEEKNSFRIAKEIAKKRKEKRIETSKELADIVSSVLKRKGKIHPATKTFQALRIFVNGELENLQKILEKIPQFMKSGGRVGIVSFHSLEDKLVKESFRKLVKEKKAVFINKKPITASYEEIKINPRSRSAKLRSIKFI